MVRLRLRWKRKSWVAGGREQTETLLVRQNSRSPVPPPIAGPPGALDPWLIAESRPCPGGKTPRGRTDHS